MNKDWNRAYKAQARSIALSYEGTKKNVLMLPGWDGLCVLEALKLKLFNKDTKGIFIERDEQTHLRQKQLLQPMLPAVTFFNGSLENAPIAKDIDYAFLDFTGSLTAELAEWLPTFFNAVKGGCGIAITFSYAARGCSFTRALRLCLNNNETLLRYCQARSKALGISDFNAMAYILALEILSERQLQFDNFIKYHDHNPMLMIMATVTNIKRQQGNEDKEFKKVLDIKAPRKSRKPNIKTPLAGHNAKLSTVDDVASRRRAIALKAVATRKARMALLK
jgi:hypothetical protein